MASAIETMVYVHFADDSRVGQVHLCLSIEGSTYRRLLAVVPDLTW